MFLACWFVMIMALLLVGDRGKGKVPATLPGRKPQDVLVLKTDGD